MTRTEQLDFIIAELKKLGPEGSGVKPLTDLIIALSHVVRTEPPPDPDYVLIDGKPVHKQFIRQLLDKAADPNWLEQIHGELQTVNEELREIQKAVHHS